MLRSKTSIKSKFNKVFSYVYFFTDFLSFPLRKKIIDQISHLKNKKVLDICCGTGINSLILSEKGANVIGIDLSKNQIFLANKRKAKDKKLKLRFKLMDAENLEFKNNAFDMAICSFGLHEVGTLFTFKKVIKEMKRVVRLKGRMIIADYNKPKNNFISFVLYKIASLFEPQETLKEIFLLSLSKFSQKYHLKPIKEKIYLFNLLKLWIFENIN